jgi:fatty-acyl-CoA synthase
MEDNPPEVRWTDTMNIPLTPLRFLRHAERQYAGRTAIVCAQMRFTYKQYGERAGLLAGALLEAGIKPGDRVAYLGLNTHRLMEAYYGVLEADAVLLPLNIRLAAAELRYVLDDAGATILLIEQPFVTLVDSFRESLSTVRMFIQLSGAPEAAWLVSDTYETLLSKATPHRADILHIDEDDVAELFYTSGTSARPKGVMLTHRNIYLHALEVCVALQVENGSTELHIIPLFHANGWGVPHFLTMLGGTHVMVHTFDPKEIFRLIEVEQVNQLSVVPIMATVMVNHPERKNYDLSSLRRIVIGGSASTPSLIREVEEKLGCNCFSGYGLTETCPVLSLAQMKAELNWKGEQRYFGQAMTGYAIPGVEMRIVDAREQDLPQNGIDFGELIVRGDGVMKGYWNQPEASAEVFRGGWFHTGDMATLNEDGYALIVDRKKDMILSGGENISSLEVERVILAHPAVLEAAVIPVSDQKWGEVPRALVVLRAGASVSDSELIDFCRSQLAHYKCPHTVVFVESLPKTGTGKVLKKDLRKQYESTPANSPAAAMD